MDSAADVFPTRCPSPSATRWPGPSSAVGAGAVRRLAGRVGRRPRRVVLRAVPPLPPRPGELLPAAHRARSAAASGTTAGWPSSCWSPPSGSWSRRTELTAEAARPAHRRGTDGLPRRRREPRRRRRRGGTALVVGVGGLGHLAIQVLRALVDRPRSWPSTRVESARALALRHGADVVVDDLALVAAALDAATSSRGGVDLVLDFVGSDATLAGAAGLLAPGGRLVVVGSAGGALVASKGRGLPGAGSSPPRSGGPVPTSRRSSRWPLGARWSPSPRPGASPTHPSSTDGCGAARSAAERSSYPT